IAFEVRAFQLAVRSAPIPDGQVQSGGCGVAKIAHQAADTYLEPVGAEVIGIDTVKIVQPETGQEAVPCDGDLLVGRPHGGQSGGELRVLLSRLRLGLLKRRQRLDVLEVVYRGEVFVETRENDDSKL